MSVDAGDIERAVQAEEAGGAFSDPLLASVMYEFSYFNLVAPVAGNVMAFTNNPNRIMLGFVGRTGSPAANLAPWPDPDVSAFATLPSNGSLSYSIRDWSTLVIREWFVNMQLGATIRVWEINKLY